jgi:pseudouridine synthase
MRINKYLSWKGYCTRAGADELIKKRAVTINGRLAVIGEQIQETDIIELRANRPQEAYVYYAYNKARGISTEPTTKGTSISQKIHLKNVFPVCGLDTHSDGLVILTNDRRIVNRLLNPAHSHMKVYAVRTVNPVKPNFKEKMEAGVILGQKDTRGAGIHGAPSVPIQCTVHMMSDSLFSIRVAETDSRVRQMVSLFFAEVENITRTEILNIKLDTLPPNSYRVIEGDELKEFLHYLGL